MGNKKIVFLLPGCGHKPSGGFKVVYEYANRLVADGYQVDIAYQVYGFSFRYLHRPFINLLRRIIALLRFVNLSFKNKYSCRIWFPLDERVKEHLLWNFAERLVPKADSYIATYITTAYYLAAFKDVPNRNKYYLIQHFENWGGVSDLQVLDSYKLPLNKIVIAKWLQQIMEANRFDCTLIPNGFDFDYFKRDFQEKDKHTVCMLYHLSDWKGCEDAFQALSFVKTKYPQLKVNIFGVPSCPDSLPDWYHYYQRPDRETHNRIYNESAIFVGPSWTEGWGLTVGEAMMCGCAVACTDNLGHREMAENEITALISPIKAPEDLATNIIRLIEDDALRSRIAEQGYRNIQRFTWDSSYLKLCNLLES